MCINTVFDKCFLSKDLQIRTTFTTYSMTLTTVNHQYPITVRVNIISGHLTTKKYTEKTNHLIINLWSRKGGELQTKNSFG
jgi:hypothetical protein